MKNDLSWFKLICTVGPSSRNPSIIKRMEECGVGIFRINLSHTPLADVGPFIREIQQASRVPVGLDTEGAQIRTGRMPEGGVCLEKGESVKLVREEVMGSASRFTLTPQDLFSALEPGLVLSVDFDTCLLQIQECHPDHCLARVLCGGRVQGNKGVAPGRDLLLASLTDKDRRAIRIARELGVRTFFFSFATDGRAVQELREEVGRDSTVISKIESHSALLHLDEIIDASDGVLVDRGDLSRSAPVEEIPSLQKLIVRKAHQKPVPVYVATNLLESMVSSPYPTRAEVNDIANTLYDGANGLVLAAETAIGKYPVQCVEMVLRMVRQHLEDLGMDSKIGKNRARRGRLHPNPSELVE